MNNIISRLSQTFRLTNFALLESCCHMYKQHISRLSQTFRWTKFSLRERCCHHMYEQHITYKQTRLSQMFRWTNFALLESCCHHMYEQHISRLSQTFRWTNFSLPERCRLGCLGSVPFAPSRKTTSFLETAGCPWFKFALSLSSVVSKFAILLYLSLRLSALSKAIYADTLHTGSSCTNKKRSYFNLLCVLICLRW